MYEMIIADVTVCVTQLVHNLHISFLANRQVLEIFNLIQDEGEGEWEGGAETNIFKATYANAE